MLTKEEKLEIHKSIWRSFRHDFFDFLFAYTFIGSWPVMIVFAPLVLTGEFEKMSELTQQIMGAAVLILPAFVGYLGVYLYGKAVYLEMKYHPDKKTLY